MKNILDAPFIKEMAKITKWMYKNGWDERNGGNVSIMLDRSEVSEYLNVDKRTRRMYPLDFDASEIRGKIFLVTGTGAYFRNIEDNPEANLGIVKINMAGDRADIVWGFRLGGPSEEEMMEEFRKARASGQRRRFRIPWDPNNWGMYTSELPTHLMAHMARLKVNPKNRVVMHCHPTYTLAMNYSHTLEDKAFTRSLWQTCTECMVVFPEGIGVLPWMLSGTKEIGEATAVKMADYRCVVWGLHGLYATGDTIDEAFGLIETIEKAAQLYMISSNLPRNNVITDAQLKEIADGYNVKYREEFLDL